MIFEQVVTGGCQSYLVGCEQSCAAALIDPEVSQIDRYLALAARDGLRIRFVIDTHTHADHFSAARQLAHRLGVPSVMHRTSPAPQVDMRVDDGEMLALGKLRLQVLHTPGHTGDSMCLTVEDRVFTGDTLLIGGTGRTDLPSGDPHALYDSLFNRCCSSIRRSRSIRRTTTRAAATRPSPTSWRTTRACSGSDRAAFVEMMNSLNLTMPTHLTEALRTNMSGGKTVAQMLAEAAATVPFMSLDELHGRISAGDAGDGFIVLDVRERDAFEKGHIAGARLLPRGQLELRVNDELPDPTRRILTCCEFGRISTLAASTLRTMGFQRAVALDGGIKAWREAGYPLETGPAG